MFLITGLGNPGKEYANTRHNVGWVALDKCADIWIADSWKKSKNANAEYSHATICGVSAELIKPQTFMNNSGRSVRYALDKHEVSPEEIIILYDDVDIARGSFKISQGRGDGGHNGIKSIISHVGSKDFVRIRIGVAPINLFGQKVQKSGRARQNFVMAQMSKKEQSLLHDTATDIARAIQVVVGEGIAEAMNKYN